MSLISFEQAHSLWRRLRANPGISDPDAMHRVEAAILAHPPRNDDEAAVISTILVDAIRTGGRVDGLDVCAAEHIQVWLCNREKVEHSGLA